MGLLCPSIIWSLPTSYHKDCLLAILCRQKRIKLTKPCVADLNTEPVLIRWQEFGRCVFNALWLCHTASLYDWDQSPIWIICKQTVEATNDFLFFCPSSSLRKSKNSKVRWYCFESHFLRNCWFTPCCHFKDAWIYYTEVFWYFCSFDHTFTSFNYIWSCHNLVEHRRSYTGHRGLGFNFHCLPTCLYLSTTWHRPDKNATHCKPAAKMSAVALGDRWNV